MQKRHSCSHIHALACAHWPILKTTNRSTRRSSHSIIQMKHGRAVLYESVLYESVLFCTTLYYAIHDSTRQHKTAPAYYTTHYTLRYATRHYTILHYTIMYYTILYYYTILSYTILYYTILYYTILYYTVLYYTILYYTILYYTVLHCTILYYIGHLLQSVWRPTGRWRKKSALWTVRLALASTWLCLAAHCPASRDTTPSPTTTQAHVNCEHAEQCHLIYHCHVTHKGIGLEIKSIVVKTM